MTEIPSVHSLQVTRTARVATLGAPASADVWWVVLHGYGQLAADFAMQFEPVVAPNRCVVAPEALSRFYVDGLESHEEVGASWMTREDRAHEIDDYVAYLDDMVQHLRSDGADPSLRVLGFSQGAATASRWALLGDPAVDRLVLWGGAPAHDLNLSAHADTLRAMDLTIVVGTDDPYVTDERRAMVRRRLAQHDIPVTVHTFEGGHRLDDDTLQTVVFDAQ
jgi:predicted esterase